FGSSARACAPPVALYDLGCGQVRISLEGSRNVR
ncbi:MAG: hypothetical protein ACI957_002478, partial [Verrucomicrobiales bacterium]